VEQLKEGRDGPVGMKEEPAHPAEDAPPCHGLLLRRPKSAEILLFRPRSYKVWPE
jgi:hypothetical protein